MSPLTFEQFSDGLAQSVASGKLGTGLYREMGILSLEMEGNAKRNASTSPHPRTGRLRASIAGEVQRSGDTIVSSLNAGSGRGKDVAYARMQELGGLQVPRLAKMLRIPLPPALTAAGVDRYATPLRVTGKGVFSLIKAKDGRLFLRNDNDGQLWYKLVRSARIPATRFLGRAFDEGKKQMPDVIKEAFKGVFPGQVLQ